MLVIPVLVFIAVTLGLAGAFLWLSPNRAAQRLQAVAGPAPKSQWTETVVRIAGPFAKLSLPSGDWESSALRISFLNAGIRHEDARLVYFAAKTVLPLALAGLAWLALRLAGQAYGMTLLLYVTVCALAGCYLPNLVLRWMTKVRQREIFENFPDAVDLLLVCIEAGLGLDSGLARVTEELRRKCVALAEELHLANLEMRAGGTRDKSLHNLALRTGVEEITTFASMLTQADKFGTSIGDSLRIFSEDLRHKRQVRAEEAAAKVPTKMLIPLVLFIFPSVIMVILGPAIIRVVRTILPMLNGVGA
jgi:tight adherence protein C